MFFIIAILLLLFLAVLGPTILGKVFQQKDYSTGEYETPAGVKVVGSITRWVSLGLGLFMIASTSFVTVGSDEAGLLKKIYGYKDLPAGSIIAVNGEKGPQAEILGPGFHVKPLINVIYDVDTAPVIEVPDGHWGYLVARDGRPLPPGTTYAEAFAAGDLNNMLDAEYFLQNGGFKGPQTSVLPPGKYRINTYLWQVKVGQVTEVPEGHVGVVKSNVVSAVNFGDLRAPKPQSCEPTRTQDAEGGALAVPLVPVGCVGIWDKPLFPGKYYINENAYRVTLVDTRVQAWEYKGGYDRRAVNLTVDADGNIKQKEKETTVVTPDDAADSAVGIKIDGYTIYQQIRTLVQVEPNNAPFIVASVGGLPEVEDRIISPATQSVTRDLSGQFIVVTEAVIDSETGKPMFDDDGNAVTRQVRRPIQPLDLIERRESLQTRVEEKIVPEGRKAGITIKEVRFLEPDLPPEVLIPRKRRQLAFEMIETMRQEQKAQHERIAKENAAATADQQHELVKKEIAVEKAELTRREKQLLGEAEKLFLTEKAIGEREYVNVLGPDYIFRLRALETVFDKLGENPELIQLAGKLVPQTVVFPGSGDSGGLESLAALLKQGFENAGSVNTGNLVTRDDLRAAFEQFNRQHPHHSK